MYTDFSLDLAKPIKQSSGLFPGIVTREIPFVMFSICLLCTSLYIDGFRVKICIVYNRQIENLKNGIAV